MGTIELKKEQLRRRTGRGWQQPPCADVVYRVLLRAVRGLLLVCTRTQRVGLANVPPTGPVIVVSNHCSVADGFVLVDAVARAGRRTRMMGTAGLFAAPGLGSLLRAVGFIPVFRRSVDPASALAPARAALQAGQCVGLYPEGAITVRDDGWPGRARTGVVRLALDSGAAVVPIAQWGTADVVGREGTRHRAWLLPLRRPRVQVLTGRPLDLRTLLGVERSQEATQQQLRAGADLVMAALCEQLEVLSGPRRARPVEARARCAA